MQLGRMRFAPTGTHTKKRKKICFSSTFFVFFKIRDYLYIRAMRQRDNETCGLVDSKTCGLKAQIIIK